MDGDDVYAVVMADFGLLTTWWFDGQPAVAVFNLRSFRATTRTARTRQRRSRSTSTSGSTEPRR
jgi:hypothetical protein